MKIAYFSYPAVIRIPRSLCFLWKFADVWLIVKKLESYRIVSYRIGVEDAGFEAYMSTSL